MCVYMCLFAYVLCIHMSTYCVLMFTYTYIYMNQWYKQFISRQFVSWLFSPFG